MSRHGFVAVLALALLWTGRSSAATIIIDEQFPGSGTVPAGWSNVASIGGTVSHAAGLLTMSATSLQVIGTNAAFNPAGTTVTLKTSIVSFSGLFNETAFGTPTNRLGFLLTQSGELGVYVRDASAPCPSNMWNGASSTLCIYTLPSIAGYSGGPIEVTLTADATGVQLSTNTGYDSGLIGYGSFPGTVSFATLPVSSVGFLAANNLGGLAPQTTSTYDRYRLFTATGSDTQTVNSPIVQSGTVATTTLSVTGTGSVNQTSGDTTVLGTMTVDAGGSYTLAGGTLDADIIAANGTFDFTGGTLSVDELQGDLTNQGGTLSPGSSPGLTEITGDYDQQSAGALLIELAGLDAITEYDQVQVGGTATLGGTLDIDLLYGFTPALGDSFDILLAEVLQGAFGTTLFPALDPGLVWNIQYLFDEIGSTDVVRLSVEQAVPVPGAVWLFGGALGALGWLRRRAQRQS